MRILIYDNNSEDTKYLYELIQQLPLDILVDKVSDYTDEVYLYSKHTYDIVFIDFQDDIGKKLLSYILKKNSQQKIITIGSTAECSENLGCGHCQTNYTKCKLIH